jgi:UDP-N-acetylmuramate--alanine ligase
MKVVRMLTAFIGGIVKTNLKSRGERENDYIVEADEFDRSFLHLHPNIACIHVNGCGPF